MCMILEDGGSLWLSEVGTSDDGVLNDCSNYWSCLYALHASHGHWYQSANAMDMFARANGMFVIAGVCSCHQLDWQSRPTDTYCQDSLTFRTRLLGSLLTRIGALRWDNYSPDSIDTILEKASRDAKWFVGKVWVIWSSNFHCVCVFCQRKKVFLRRVLLFDEALQHILCSRPDAQCQMQCCDCGLESLQSQSIITNIHLSSSACALGTAEQHATVPITNRIWDWSNKIPRLKQSLHQTNNSIYNVISAPGGAYWMLFG